MATLGVNNSLVFLWMSADKMFLRLGVSFIIMGRLCNGGMVICCFPINKALGNLTATWFITRVRFGPGLAFEGTGTSSQGFGQF